MNRTTTALLIFIPFAALGIVGCGADSPSNPKTGDTVPAPAAAQTTGGLGGNDGGVFGSGGVVGIGATGGTTGDIITGGSGGIVGSGGSSSGTTSPPSATPPPDNTALLGLESLTTSAPGAVGGQSAIGAVTLITAAPAGGIIVELSAYNDAVSTPKTITIPAGASQATFPITTGPVTQVTPDVIVATIPVGHPNLQTVNFTVTPSDAAVSKLSTTNCTPGQPVTVSLIITPPAGSHAYAGSDAVPRGSTVANLGPAGSPGTGANAGIVTGVGFDATDSSVNFFFLDAAPRTITYTFTPPPSSANSTIILSGVVAFDGISQPILGDRMIHCSS